MTENIDPISQSEVQKDNVRLDATIPLLSRKLLYGNLSQEDEIKGYKHLRSLTVNSDEIIQRAAGDALDDRWEKVGFYVLHTPSKMFSFGKNDRAHFRKAGSSGLSSGVGDEEKVAILELCRKTNNGNKSLSAKQFEDTMTSLIGVQNYPELISSLKKLYVLTDEGQYVPVIEVKRGKIILNDLAKNVIKPNLPVLEAISYPEQITSEDSKKIALAVGREIETSLARSIAFFKEDNINGLVSPRQRSYFMPDLRLLEMQLRGEKLANIGFKGDVVPFLTEEGIIYDIIHNAGKDSDLTSEKESVVVNVHKHPQGIEGRLINNFWGEAVRGEELGKLKIYKLSSGISSIEAEGFFIATISPDLKNPNRIEISSRDMEISWNDVSEKEKNIYLTVSYQKSQGRNVLVGSAPTSIRVPEASKSRDPLLDTTYKDILLDKDQDTIEINHPKGKYKVSYKRSGNVINFKFVGTNWDKEIDLPLSMDVQAIAKSLSQELAAVTNKITENRESIKNQVANIKNMNLVEYIYFKENGVLPTLPVSEFTVDKNKYLMLDKIDKSLSKLDPNTQEYVKYYIVVLAEMQRTRPIDEKIAKEMGHDVEDPRQQFRSIINKYVIMIPEEILVLIETLFMPREYRVQ